MATSVSTTNPNQTSASNASFGTQTNDLLVCLPCVSHETREIARASVAQAFPNQTPLIGVVEPNLAVDNPLPAPFVAYADSRANAGWALTASDFLAAGNLSRKHQTHRILLLGSETLSPAFLQNMDGLLQAGADVVIPRLHAGPSEGLVNAGILYPLTRALFGTDIRFPLPHNIALSQRAMERLILEAQREVVAGKNDSLLWPVSIAAASGLTIRQIESDEPLPSPNVPDFNRLFTEVVGSLFADAESKAVLWQRGRYVAPSTRVTPAPAPAGAGTSADVAPMIEGFHVAYANLLDIWSLVLPPQSLLALKRLASVPADAFSFPPELWARTVYDFTLAFHLRTLNRNHLMGAMTPIYLAWAASHIRAAAGDPAESERHSQETASAFEAEKPYFVSRWRWPDRFNP